MRKVLPDLALTFGFLVVDSHPSRGPESAFSLAAVDPCYRGRGGQLGSSIPSNEVPSHPVANISVNVL